MAKNLLEDATRSWNSFGTGTVSRKVGLSRAEELAIIRGHWLHTLPESECEQGRQQLTVKAEMAPPEGASGISV